MVLLGLNPPSGTETKTKIFRYIHFLPKFMYRGRKSKEPDLLSKSNHSRQLAIILNLAIQLLNLYLMTLTKRNVKIWQEEMAKTKYNFKKKKKKARVLKLKLLSPGKKNNKKTKQTNSIYFLKTISLFKPLHVNGFVGKNGATFMSMFFEHVLILF